MKTLLPVSVVVLMEVFSTLADLSKSLKYYETLKDVQIHSRSKRSAHTEPIVDVRFKTLGKDFRLILQKRKHLFTNDFRAVVQGKDGKVSHFEVDERRVLTGHLYGEAYSDVSAYISDTQVISAHIETEDEIYFIEPSEGHLEDSENYTMISYRGSDMLYSYKKSHQQDGKFCQFLRPEGGVVIEDDMTPVSHVDVDEAGPAYHFSMSNHTGSRQKRQSYTPLKETCPLMVVADYKFHLNIGRGKLERTASYMIGVIDRVDKLYRSTVWDTSDNFQGIGFEIKEIKIHEGYTPVQGKELHYNMDKTDWETKELLEVFSRSPSYRSYCLVHLFTHQKFNGGVLGLAYIASPRASSVGGICSPLYLKDGYRMSLNTGWSSSLNTAGKRILSQEAQLVAAHELGHNFGSEHDTDNKQCAPEARLGGKYLMYPFAVSGYEANNNKFSICSRGNINNVLRFKADDCFKVKSNAFCGNGIVEPGEDCDAGFKGRAGNDPCCGKDCRLIEPAVCSDYNQPCCKECQAAGPDVVCEQSSVDSTSCLGEARCAGGFTCPDPSPKPDNIECVEKGRCQNGKCIPFCESRNKISCQCDTVAESCTVCCKAAFDAACLVEMVDEGGSQHPWYLTDGRPCVQGFCEKGECKKTKADLIVRIWDIIDNITIDTFVEFMRSNIVGTVLVLSLLIWIPGSCIITCVDRRREKKEKERREWLKATNRLLLRGEDKNGTVERIKTVNHVKLNRPMGSIVRDSKPQVTTTHTSVL